MSEPVDRNELAARAILRTLLACGDNEEKQLRFLAMMLRQMQDNYAEDLHDRVEYLIPKALG